MNKKDKMTIYFYEWYNGNENCIGNYDKNNYLNTIPIHLNLPKYTLKPHNYQNITNDYDCITSVDYLTQTGGYNKKWFETYYIKAKYRIDKVSDEMKQMHHNKRNKYFSLLKSSIKIFIDNYKIKQYLNKINHDCGFIYKLSLDSNSNVIIIGDIHGSYHTFFRHMVRLERKGILKYNEYDEPVLNKTFTLLFLGDIIDRGKHRTNNVVYIIIN